MRNLIGSTAGNFSQNQVRITFHPGSLEFILNRELLDEVPAKKLAKRTPREIATVHPPIPLTLVGMI